MKFAIKLLAINALLTGNILAHTIEIQYHLHQKEAIYILERLEEHYKIPSKLIQLKWLKKPCQNNKRNRAAVLCLKDKDQRLKLVSFNKQILKESYSIFRKN